MENLKKQTVYLPVNDTWVEGKPTLMSSDGEWVCNLYQNIGYFFTPEQLNDYTQNVIKQSLETAAKKAECCEDAIVILGHTITEAYVKKESITNTFEETFKLFKNE